jgi:hypothetical protein
MQGSGDFFANATHEGLSGSGWPEMEARHHRRNIHCSPQCGDLKTNH